MGTLDSREFDRLKGRKFKPYSLGHRLMYDKPIQMLKGNTYSVLEAGFGIGYGLDRMLEAGILRSYVGFEPNADSFNYVAERIKGKPGVTLILAPFNVPGGSTFCEEVPSIEPSEKFDHAFCIEVIEHVPLDQQAAFLSDLRRVSDRLWFSTPDIRRYPKEGVRTTEEWVTMLTAAGFQHVEVDRSQWTHLFQCRA